MFGEITRQKGNITRDGSALKAFRQVDSQDQSADNSDTTSTDEVEMIAEEQPERRAGVLS